MLEALAIFVKEGQYLHGVESKKRTLFFFKKHIPRKIMSYCGKGNGALLFFCSHGANNSRGVAIFIRNNFDCSVEEIVTDADGRYIMLNVLLKGERTNLVNIYGPNRDNKLVDFYHSVLKSIKINVFDSDNIIMGGDFNCPLNPILDKRGGNLMPRQSVINAIERLQWELDLHDIWRIKNPTERSFTWSQPEPLVLSRLDYWLISNSISDNVCDVDIIPSIKTDHDDQDVGDGVKGSGTLEIKLLFIKR